MKRLFAFFSSLILFFVATFLLSNTTPAYAVSCSPISIWITHPAVNGGQPVQGTTSGKITGIPEFSPFTITIRTTTPDQQFTFNSNTDRLVLLSNPAGTTVTHYLDSFGNPRNGFKLSGKGTVNFSVKFVDTGLTTIGVQSPNNSCGSAEAQLVPTPGNGPGPVPQPCSGINVNVTYSHLNGPFVPVEIVSQNPNVQLAGPKVGDVIMYVVTPANGVVDFTNVLKLLVTTNRQQITSATPNGTIAADSWHATFLWDAQTLTLKTKALTSGLAFVGFSSTNYPGSSINNVCSTHAELRIGQ